MSMGGTFLAQDGAVWQNGARSLIPITGIMGMSNHDSWADISGPSSRLYTTVPSHSCSTSNKEHPNSWAAKCSPSTMSWYVS